MTRKALVVGINRYPNFRGKGKAQHLENAPLDAEAIAEILRDYGRFEVTLLPETCTDGTFTADEKGIVHVKTLQNAIYELFVKPPDGTQTALLFFAGHGLVKTEFDEEFGYLCGSDTNCQDHQILGVKFDWLVTQLAKSQVTEQMIWLDCCHSGRLTTQEIFKQANPGIKRSIIASCRDAESSLDVDGHGVLTHLLKKVLNPEFYDVGFNINSYEIEAAVAREFDHHPKFKTYPQRPISSHSGTAIHFWDGRGKQSSQPPSFWRQGYKLQNRPEYIIEGILGRGGFGITYKARHLVLNKLVVLKTPHAVQKLDPNHDKFVKRFTREGQFLAKFCQQNAHPSIVQVIDFFKENGTPCLVMDFVPGETLFNLVRQQGPLSESEAVGYISQIGAALVQVHQAGILHRDVHPGNILLAQNKAILIDFGIACEIIPTGTSSHYSANVDFSPWEQQEHHEDSRKVTVDIYTLAASLYYAVTGQVPTGSVERKYFNADLLLPTGISDRTREAILKGMAIDARLVSITTAH